MRTIGLNNVPLPYANSNNERVVSIFSYGDTIEQILERLKWQKEGVNLIFAEPFSFNVVQREVNNGLVFKFKSQTVKELHTLYWFKVWLEESEGFPEAKSYPYAVLKSRRRKKVL